jgi:single-stranded-DNA-specific exonuclease
LTSVDGILKGSARSIPDFNLYEALKECEDILLQFGGHKAAAGLSIHYDKINDFKKRFNEVAKKNLTPEQLIPTLEIEAIVELNSITPKFRRILDRFAPFGPQNMKPIFLTEKVEIFDRPRINSNNHLFMKVRKNGSMVFDTVGYNLGEYAQSLLDLNGSIKNTYIDIVYTIESNTINDMVFPLLNLKDFRISQK